MILEQHYLACLAQASYLIADETSGTAVVVDPRRDVDLYVERAAELGVTIRHVLLTHFHADFLAGHLELRERTGCDIWLGARAKAEFAFHPMRDGETLDLGEGVRLRFLETPGHTPESVSIVVHDLAEDPEVPRAVLTGDTLFIGDVGRPDLMASVGLTAEELAGWLHDSLHGKLLELPDETIVYPGHGAGSMCGKNLSSETSSTLGQQRATNYALQPMSREEFVGLLTANQPKAPAYFPYDARLNGRERPVLEDVLRQSVKPLGLDEVLARANAGAVVLDSRDADAFALGHLPGSVNIGLGGSYATWVGTLVDVGKTIVLVSDPGKEEESIRRLGRIGFDRVAGYLEGGIETARGEQGLLRSNERLSPDEARERLEGEDPPLLVDVRTPGEWEAGHVEGALHVPLAELRERVDELPEKRKLVLVCKTGYRSSTAASLLESRQEAPLLDVRGGMDAWTGATCSA